MPQPVGSVLRSVRAHPIAVVLTAVALTLGIALVTIGWHATSSPQPASFAPFPPPHGSAGPGPVRMLGPVSLESADASGRFIGVSGDDGALVAAGTASPAAVRRSATLTGTSGLADPGCLSFRAADGRFLRRSAERLRLSEIEHNALFRSDATFCARRGTVPQSIALESFARPGSFVCHVGDLIGIGRLDASGAFLVRKPLA